MPDVDVTGYFRAREKVERAIAARSDDPAITAIHLDLASRYAAAIRDLKPDPNTDGHYHG